MSDVRYDVVVLPGSLPEEPPLLEGADRQAETPDDGKHNRGMKKIAIVATALLALFAQAQDRKCQKCCGSGTAWVTCPDCKGSGNGEYVHRGRNGNRHGYRSQCGTCGGTMHRGKVKGVCPACGGSGAEAK